MKREKKTKDRVCSKPQPRGSRSQNVSLVCESWMDGRSLGEAGKWWEEGAKEKEGGSGKGRGKF